MSAAKDGSSAWRRVGRRAGVTAELNGRIASGALRPGDRLPSLRRFAAEMAVATSTVVDAYDGLVAEGAIVSRPGSGFYVRPPARPSGLAAQPVPDRVVREVDPLWVMRHSLEAGVETLIPGCGWLPDDWLAEDAVRRALRAVARAGADKLLAYGRPLGFEPLRRILAGRLADRDIPATADRLLLTDSATAALDLICRLLLRPGDTVVVDDPCYFNFLNILRAHRARVVGVPYGPDGPDAEAFGRLLAAEPVRLYVTSSGPHNPTGGTSTPAIRHALLRLAQAQDIVIVEDDIFGDLDPDAGPGLAALDGLSRVLRIGGFSKTVSAAFRCGYVSARSDWIAALADLKLATTFGGNDVAAAVLHHVLTEGAYRRHLDTLRNRLDRTRPLVIERLQAAGLAIRTEPRAGLFVWAELRPGHDADHVAQAALASGIVLAPGNAFSVGRQATRHLRFNVAQSLSPRVFAALGAAMSAAPRHGYPVRLTFLRSASSVGGFPVMRALA